MAEDLFVAEVIPFAHSNEMTDTGGDFDGFTIGMHESENDEIVYSALPWLHAPKHTLSICQYLCVIPVNSRHNKTWPSSTKLHGPNT